MERGSTPYSRDPLTPPSLEAYEANDADPIAVDGHVVNLASGTELGSVSFTAAANEAISPTGARRAARTAVVSELGSGLGSVSVADELVGIMVEEARESLARAEAAWMSNAEFYADLSANDMGDGIAEAEEPLMDVADEAEPSTDLDDGLEVEDSPTDILEGDALAFQLEGDEVDDTVLPEADDEGSADGDEIETTVGEGDDYTEVLGAVLLQGEVDVPDIYDVSDVEETTAPETETSRRLTGVQEAVRSLVLREVSVAELEADAVSASEYALGILGVIGLIELGDEAAVEVDLTEVPEVDVRDLVEVTA